MTQVSVMKPKPRITALERPFWDGCNAHRLMIQHCTACSKAVFYPRACCPHCHADRLEWIQASGSGRVISHTTVWRTHHDGFNGEVPYVFAAIQLDEGACIYGQLLHAPVDGPSLVGTPVVAVFIEHRPGQKVAAFTLTP
jgi:uncharacterized OB-fold protein